MSFFEELKRRNVFRVGIAYLVASWLLMQVADLVFPRIGLSDSSVTLVIALLAIGFVPALIFAWAFELTPEGIKKEKDVDRSQSITPQTGRKLDFVIIGILAVALSYFAYDKFASVRSESASVGGRSAADSRAENGKSIAVLPFVNMSDDASNEYFSDGISEEILNALAKVPDLQVAGRTSSFAFKGENQDLRLIGEALGVGHILEGSVRKAGDKVRITAQLIRVDNGFHLWSESYDRELTDVFAIQDEIANAILTQLKAQLVEGEVQVVTTTRTNSVAYDRYLLARQRMYERHRASLESAAALLDEAIAIDPEYAPAYAQRGIVANLLGENQYGAIPMAQSRTQSKLFIDQALRLDPELAEGWAALGLYYQTIPGERAKSIEALEKALSIAPGSIDTANWLSIGYVDTAQPAKSQTLLEDVMQRDPLYRPGLGNLSFWYLASGQLEKVKALADKFREQLPQDRDSVWLDGEILQWEGKIAASLPLSEAAVGLQPQDFSYRTQMSRGLLYTHQYEQVAEEGYWFLKVTALRRLGRIEEATLLAQEWAAQGEIASYFRLLTATDRSELLLDYVEERWPDLGAFEADFPANSYFGYSEMSDIAWAYRQAGNQEKFNEAMSRVRAAHDSLATQGLNNKFFFANEAVYFAMAGDRAKALKFLSAAVDGGEIFATRIADDLPFFSEFEGDPEYEAIQARMMEHLNRERAQLGLEPVTS